MTEEQKRILEVKFPKELPKGHTDTEKLTQARWRIAQLDKMLYERKDADTVRRELWTSVFMGTMDNYTFKEVADAADKALALYDKTFHGQ